MSIPTGLAVPLQEFADICPYIDTMIIIPYIEAMVIILLMTNFKIQMHLWHQFQNTWTSFLSYRI